MRVGYAIAIAATAAWAVFCLTGAMAPPFAALPVWILPLTAMLLATALCVARAVAVRHERLAWAFLAGALVLWTAGDALSFVPSPAGGLPASIGWADVAYFANSGTCCSCARGCGPSRRAAP